jgi:hypothetical protein
VIRGSARQAHETAERGAVHDRAAALLAHLAELVFHACPDTAQVDRVDTIQALGRLIGRVTRRNLHAGIVERHVQPTEGGNRALDHRGGLSFICHVAGDAGRLCPAAVRWSVAACTAASSMSASTTAAPASPNAWGVTSPMPEPSPVTSAT